MFTTNLEHGFVRMNVLVVNEELNVRRGGIVESHSKAVVDAWTRSDLI